MERVYLDNCSTSFPKAEGLGNAVAYFIDNISVSYNRTSSKYATTSYNFLFTLRKNLCTLFHYSHPECVIFTKNITESLNVLIKGYLKKGDHVVITSFEHNAVMRVLNQVGINYSKISSDELGYSIVSEVESLINDKTRAFIINVACNVSGAVQDIVEISKIANKHNIPIILDTAQSAPYIDVNMTELNISALAFTGHKGLLGPQGTGGFIIKKEFANKVEPLITGGSGSLSSEETQPLFLPDKFTSGTENMPGLYGLNYSLEYVMSNLGKIREHVRQITLLLITELSKIKQLKIIGPQLEGERVGVVSVIINSNINGGLDSNFNDISALSDYLLENNIESRVGLHCCPSAHKALGTFPTGTLRFSPSFFSSEKDIYYLCNIINSFFKN